MGQVYGGGLRPVVAMDPYDVSARVVSDGGSQQQQLQQQVYYGVRNGAVVSPYNPDDWLLRDGMTRAPCVKFNSAKRAAELKFYLEEPNDYDTLSTVFNRSSRFGRLQTIKCAIVGKNLCIRFTCSTGDAMGMNMVSKGVQNVLDFLQNDFPDMDVIGISGNYCSDKKPAAVNWIEGRGKSVVCEAVIKGDVVQKVLKTKLDGQRGTWWMRSCCGASLELIITMTSKIAKNFNDRRQTTSQPISSSLNSTSSVSCLAAANNFKDRCQTTSRPRSSSSNSSSLSVFVLPYKSLCQAS
ncbi:hypothetical protein ACFX2G_044707 [Malus domestica]